MPTLNPAATSPADRAQRGTTLIELFLTLGIVFIVSAVSVPTFHHLIRNNQRTLIVNELVSTAFYAKTEAIKRLEPVVLCGSDDGVRCHRGNNWHTGWLVFVNRDRNFPPTIGIDDDILTYRKLSVPHYVKTNRAYYQFRPISKRSTNGTLTVCDERGEYEARAVIISPLGRPRASKTLADGSPIPCDPL